MLSCECYILQVVSIAQTLVSTPTPEKDAVPDAVLDAVPDAPVTLQEVLRAKVSAERF